MHLIRGILCGVGGILVALCLWAAVAHFSGHSASMFAIAAGICVGLGVMYGVHPRAGWVSGLAASVLALGCIIAGRHVSAEFAVSNRIEQAQDMATISDRAAVQYLKDEVLRDMVREGRVSELPKGAEYPTEVTEEARRRWAAMGPTQREIYKGKLAESFAAEAGQVAHEFNLEKMYAQTSTLDKAFALAGLCAAFFMGRSKGRKIYTDELEQQTAESLKKDNPVIRGAPSGASSAPSPSRAMPRPARPELDAEAMAQAGDLHPALRPPAPPRSMPPKPPMPGARPVAAPAASSAPQTRAGRAAA